MANYFNETEVKTWNIIQYHKNWISTYKEDPIKLTYNKASDNLLKSLRNIVDKSLDSTKIRKACELLSTSKARIIILYFVVLQDKSLHMNFCHHNKEVQLFGVPLMDYSFVVSERVEIPNNYLIIHD